MSLQYCMLSCGFRSPIRTVSEAFSKLAGRPVARPGRPEGGEGLITGTRLITPGC